VQGDEVHADGRPEFLATLDQLMSVQEGGVRLSAPARALSSEDLVRRAPRMAELLPWTFSCHIGEFPCGQCRGCTKHKFVLDAIARTP
jgi:7-cyano-7-deazaguanine synthase